MNTKTFMTFAEALSFAICLEREGYEPDITRSGSTVTVRW